MTAEIEKECTEHRVREGNNREHCMKYSCYLVGCVISCQLTATNANRITEFKNSMLKVECKANENIAFQM